MPPGVAVSPSSIAPGYAACTLINAQQDRQQQALLRGTFPGSVADMHVGTGSSASSSSSSSSSSSRSSSSSSGESAELSDKDQLQVESCYKGLKTQVRPIENPRSEFASKEVMLGHVPFTPYVFYDKNINQITRTLRVYSGAIRESEKVAIFWIFFFV